MDRAGIAWAAAPRVTRVVWLPGGTTNLAGSSNERGGPYLATEERHGHVFGHTVRHVVQSHLHLIAHAGTVRLAHEATDAGESTVVAVALKQTNFVKYRKHESLSHFQKRLRGALGV